MELSSKMFHINAGLKNQFIFKLSIVKNLDMFNVLLELFKLNIQDNDTLQIVIDHCNNSPHRKQLLKKVDNQLIDSIHLNYYEIEKYLPILYHHLFELTKKNQDENKLMNFPICNKFNVIFNVNQINRLYNDLNAFYQNYMILDSVFNLLTLNVDKKPVVKSVTAHVDNLKKVNEIVKNEQSNLNLKNTDFDDVLSLCINHSLKSFLIHMSINYYIYMTNKIAFVESNDSTKTVNVCLLFPSLYVFNSDYLKSLTFSLFSYSLDDINMRINKLINGFNTIDTPLIVMCKTCLLFLYYLVYVNETHSNYLLSNLDNVFTNADSQFKILNNHTKVYLKNNLINFKITELHIDNLNELKTDVILDELGEKYNHLITVDEEAFIDSVSKELKELNSLEDINFNNKHIINLKSLHNLKIAASKKQQSIKENNLLDPQNTIDYDQQFVNLFEYNFDDDFLTLSHKYFNEFILNQSNFILNLKQNKYDLKLVSLTTIKLFPIIHQALYDKQTPIIKSNNTYTYYKHILKLINDPKVFSHYTYLFIIYQIIIPFMYKHYNMFEFEDVF